MNTGTTAQAAPATESTQDTGFPRSRAGKNIMQIADTILREHGVYEDIRRVVIEGRVTGVLIESPTGKARK